VPWTGDTHQDSFLFQFRSETAETLFRKHSIPLTPRDGQADTPPGAEEIPSSQKSSNVAFPPFEDESVFTLTQGWRTETAHEGSSQQTPGHPGLCRGRPGPRVKRCSGVAALSDERRHQRNADRSSNRDSVERRARHRRSWGSYSEGTETPGHRLGQPVHRTVVDKDQQDLGFVEPEGRPVARSTVRSPDFAC